MKLTRSGAIVSCCAALVLALPACGDDDDSGGDTSASGGDLNLIEDGTLTLTDKVKRRVVQERYAALKTGRTASICGRYFAMDRDRRWDRTKRAWDAIVLGRGDVCPSMGELDSM